MPAAVAALQLPDLAGESARLHMYFITALMQQHPQLIIDLFVACRDRKRSSLVVNLGHCLMKSSIYWQEARVMQRDDTLLLLSANGQTKLPLPEDVVAAEEWRYVMLDVTTTRVVCVYLVPMFSIFGATSDADFRTILDNVTPMIATTTQASIEPFPVAQAVPSSS